LPRDLFPHTHLPGTRPDPTTADHRPLADDPQERRYPRIELPRIKNVRSDDRDPLTATQYLNPAGFCVLLNAMLMMFR
jgi:hypothetical protein